MMAASLLVLTVFAGYQYSLLGYHRRETCSYGSPNTTTADHLHKNAFAHQDFLPQSNTSDAAERSVCDSETLPAGLRYVSFLALVTYVAAYSLSFGPITWVLLSELFPVSLKGDAMSLGQAVNWVANVFVSVTFLDAIRLFTLPAVFAFYLVMSLAAAVFVHLVVPETKGKTLEQISKDLRGGARAEGGGCGSAAGAPGREPPERRRQTKDFAPLADSRL
jgi:SP family facilitated glucose transporter-like MFS transporter 12